MNRQQRMHTDVVIQSRPDAIWGVLNDVATWPVWNPCISSTEPPSALDAGTEFAASQNFRSIRCTCTSLDEERRIAWRCESLARKSLVVCTIYSDGPTTTVTFDELVESWTLLWRGDAERADFERRAELFKAQVELRARR